MFDRTPQTSMCIYSSIRYLFVLRVYWRVHDSLFDIALRATRKVAQYLALFTTQSVFFTGQPSDVD
jgi:hypothetical protein